MTLSHILSSRDQLGETFRFTQGMLEASAAVMFWIHPDRTLEHAYQTGLSDALFNEYFKGFDTFDPLSVDRLIERQDRVAFFQRERLKHSDSEMIVYEDFLSRHGVEDEVDFVFWQDGCPIAVIGVMKGQFDPPFQPDHFQWETMRRHLEAILQQHPHVRQARKEMVLTQKFNLTGRELQVVELLQIGASNAKIAQIMGIGVATVKTYIVNILNKMGMDSRFSVVAYTSSI
ncbi:MAG: LuxR C-terminal-related transcriptional regulator [Novosphingobium sp.]